MKRSRPRVVAALVSCCLSATALAAVAAPVSAAPLSGFRTSFENGEPQPDWSDSVEGDKASGVRGPEPQGMPGSVMEDVTSVDASGENASAGEVADNLADGDKTTKWLVTKPTGWVSYTLGAARHVTKYAMTAANDAPERDPKDWRLQGSTDGERWTTLDERKGESFGARYERKVYEFDTDTSYTHFRLDVTANHGEDLTQLAELELSTGKASPPPAPTMESHVSSGPVSAYNAKARTGFTGVRSLRYAGRHTAEGHAFSYNRVLAVDQRVAKDTVLSYRIFPEFEEGDLRYPSTYAALDLKFTDGTYLSDLPARDQYGNPAAPDEQGASKRLSADQWNDVSVNVGVVAAGKTVERVLVAYDSREGPADFHGWIDDIALAAPEKVGTPTHPSDWVTTLRGTNSSGAFSRGNNVPATAVPNGFNFWTPVTDAGSTSWLYDYARRNDDQNRTRLEAFGVSHEPSPWMGDRQTFQVMPASGNGKPTADRAARAKTFDHANEQARPHYYGVRFDDGTRTEIAPTDHAAMFRFTFPSSEGSLVFDNVNDKGGLRLDEKNGVVSGYSDVKSGLSAGAGRMFVYGVVDRQVSDSGRLADGGGEHVGGYLRFRSADQITMRIATSFIGVEQAKRNLEQEIPADRSFGDVRAAAQRQWDERLGVVEVEGASRDQLTTLYSNLYRLFLYPNSYFENTGTKARHEYSYASPVSPQGEDTPTHTGAEVVRGKMYVNNGFWDTYRTAWPAYSFFAPKKAGELVDGFVQQYRDGGWISRWSSPGYANLMVGTSSDVAFADAYLKGVPGIDLEDTYDAALRNAAAVPPDENVGRKGLAESSFLGYTPLSSAEGFSWSMDGYVNDFGIANLSKAMYDKAKPSDPRKREYLDNYRYYLNRARGYVALYDRKVGFFQGKDADGVWHKGVDAYDPRAWGGDYTETNGWNMAFSVPQDGTGLAALHGGRAGLAKKLDEFYGTPETAEHPGTYGGVIHEMREARDVRMGQYGHSNQPSHHIPYMYDFAGQPWKAQQKVREVMDRLYTGSAIGQGYPGDEDNGEMSAWYLFSMLGFYPLQVGSPSYAVGSPLFEKATVHLGGGRDLVVNAPGNDRGTPYVKGLTVNGKRWSGTSIPHEELANGGRLDFTMSSEPTSWGAGRDAAPPSLTPPGERPTTWHDSMDDTGARVDGGAQALHDNSAATEASSGTVTLDLVEPRRVRSYTLTSGAKPAEVPSGWRLQGSSDGSSWHTLDTRKGETFAWGSYTRSFGVQNPGRYAHYRLVFDGGGRLAELELTGTPKYADAGTHPTGDDALRKKPDERNYG